MGTRQLRLLIREAIRQIISEEKEERRSFLRFGDPRKVPGGRSMIHEPGVYEDSLERFAYDPDGPRLQKYESGISAYPVEEVSDGKVVFRAPIGMHIFVGQINDLLFDRFLEGDIYVFEGVTTGTYGTDDEPLVAEGTITNVKKIHPGNLYVKEGGVTKRIADMISKWSLRGHHDMGSREFFKRRISVEELDRYIDGLLEVFKLPEQVNELEKIRAAWREEIEEEHER